MINLKSLDLAATKVTAAGVTELRQTLTNGKILK